MRKFELFRRGAALLTATTISLSLVGCNSERVNNDEALNNLDAIGEFYRHIDSQYSNTCCKHLDIQFGNVIETFSECAGYDITASFGLNSSTCSYVISKDGSIYISGETNSYNYYSVNHNVYEGSNPAIQKVK